MPLNPAHRRRREGLAFLAAFALCIPLANWMVTHVGFVCVPDGPCLVPVAPGVLAPTAVLMVGLALVLRDLVQRRLGLWGAVWAIGIGGLLSWLVAEPSVIAASVAAFLFSELADLAVYTPLQKRRLVLAVVLSSIVGLTVDTVIFLYLAFGNLDFMWGQIIGKTWMVLLSIPVIQWLRKRDERLNLQPA